MKQLSLLAALAVMVHSPAFSQDDEDSDPGFNEATFKGLEFRSIGPAFMSGRIADIAIDQNDTSTWYVAVGSGGVWKTTNEGTTWEPIFPEGIERTNLVYVLISFCSFFLLSSLN